MGHPCGVETISCVTGSIFVVCPVIAVCSFTKSIPSLFETFTAP